MQCRRAQSSERSRGFPSSFDEKTSNEVSLSPRFARSRETKARIDSPVVVLTWIGDWDQGGANN